MRDVNRTKKNLNAAVLVIVPYVLAGVQIVVVALSLSSSVSILAPTFALWVVVVGVTLVLFPRTIVAIAPQFLVGYISANMLFDYGACAYHAPADKSPHEICILSPRL
jgi:uncharacterized membrane protein